MSFDPGTKLGPYEIISPLGAGGMGEVYRARDTRLGREVAVKVLPEHLSSTAEIRARFEREAKTVSGLNHPHICTLFDVGREGDTDYLVMELIEGETLAQRLARGALPVPDVLRLGSQIADALDRAHRAGVVHRDLKPGNIMLTRSGAKLMDFGLARSSGLRGPSEDGASPTELAHSPTIAAPLTAEGTLVGTFQYMSPEQLEGHEADTRSDIWSLGCVLYEMATGKNAFQGRSQASLIASVLEHEPPAIASLVPLAPATLDRVVHRCLAKDPEDRWQSSRDLAAELAWIGEADSRATADTPSVKPKRTRPWLPWALVVLLTALSGLLLLSSLHKKENVRGPHEFHQLAYRTGAIFRALFAPDGASVVYSAAPEGNVAELYTIRPEYPEPRPLGLKGAQLLSVSSQGELAILTDAKFIGHRLFSGTLARVSLGGGAPRELSQNVREADWSPDGTQLAVIRDEGSQDQLEYPMGQVLCRAAGYMSDLSVSPKGDLIAYFQHPARYDDRGSVNLVDLEGKVTVLSEGYWGEEGLSWTADGSEILFSASYGGYDLTVYAITPEGKRRVALQSAGGLTIQDVAKDGRWLVTRDDQRTELMVHKPQWKRDRNLSWLDLSGLGGLTPDGNTLVFSEMSGAMGTNYATCFRKTDGSPVVRLGEGMVADITRDGTRVLSIIPSTPTKLVIYPLGVGEIQKLAPGKLENCFNARWLPDEKGVVLGGNLPSQAPQFFVVDLNGDTLRPVTPPGTLGGFLSTDGKNLLVSVLGKAYAIYRLSGGEPKPVTGLTEDDAPIRWSADDRSILVKHGAGVPCRVERVDLETGERHSLRRNRSSGSGWRTVRST